MQIFRKSQISQLAQDFRNYQRDSQLLQSNAIAYFVGITGSGKSLIINHLLGYFLQVQRTKGIRQIILKDSQPGQKAIIGTGLATSCTKTPKLFAIKGYNNLLLCDTAGYNDTNSQSHNYVLLNEMYITKAQEIAAIIMVVNMTDIRSQRGGGFTSVFEELEKISNFKEVKRKMQFIINYKNLQQDGIEDLFNQFVEYEKEIEQCHEHTLLIQSKRRFFEIIFDKGSLEEPPNFEKFKKKIMISTKEQLLNPKSDLRKQFFSRVLEMKGKQTLSLNPSKARFSLTKQLVRGILARQSSLQKCLAKYEIYYKSKIIEVNLWKELEEEESSSAMRAKTLNDILFTTDIDLHMTQNLILKLSAQIAEFQQQGRKLFKAYQFDPHDDQISQEGLIQVSFNLNYQIKNVFKQVEGFTIENEKLDLKAGKYEVKFRPIKKAKNKKIRVMSVATYEQRDKEMTNYLQFEKRKFQQKLESKILLQNLPFKEQLKVLVEIIKKNQDQKQFTEFVQKYSLQNEEMFRTFPNRQDLGIYTDELMIYNAIVSNVDVRKDCIDLIFLDNLKKIPFLEFTPKKGYCSINYHQIHTVVRLECGHQYQEYCWNRYLDKTKQNNLFCIICKDKPVKVEVELGQKKRYKENFENFFRLKNPKISGGSSHTTTGS